VTYDVVVVGAGPAGLSAAIWLGRCRRRVLVCDDGRPRNRRSPGVHGFLGHDGIDPFELRARGVAEASAYGVEFRDVEVTGAELLDGGGYELTLAEGRPVRCRKLLLATGLVDRLPDLPGLDALFGRSVFHCPYCDGWEVKDTRLAAYGRGRGGAGLALTLRRWSDDVHLFTDGASRLDREARDHLAAQGVTVHAAKVLRLEGDDGQLRRVVLRGERPIERDALFFGLGRTQRSDLPALLGCRFDAKGAVLARRSQGVDRPDLFVAGDAVRDVNFAIVAAAEGARAAYTINSALTREDQRRGDL
jgi:thioredoxin reductase